MKKGKYEKEGYIMANIFKTEDCPICGNPTNAIEKTSMKCEGKFICKSCGEKIMESDINPINVHKMTANDLREKINMQYSNSKEKENFNTTKQIGDSFYLDATQNKFAIPTGVTLTGKVKGIDIYNCKDIIDFELIEDDNSISKGGVGRALVGGVLFGGVGAIVGSSTAHKKKETCTKLQIKITMNNIDNPVVYISLIDYEVKKNSLSYKINVSLAQEILSLLDVLCQANKSNMLNEKQGSDADEILKFKDLLDRGIITEEEFNAKKAKLLGL